MHYRLAWSHGLLHLTRRWPTAASVRAYSLRTAPGNPPVITQRPTTDHFVPIMNTSTVQLSQTQWHQEDTLPTVE